MEGRAELFAGRSTFERALGPALRSDAGTSLTETKARDELVAVPRGSIRQMDPVEALPSPCHLSSARDGCQAES